MNVLVAGAGPTGLTAAVELARRGIEVKLVEKRSEGSGFSRAVGILPKSLELLEPCGATERLLAEGVKIDGARIFDGDRKVLSVSFRPDGQGRDFILGLAQDRTETILRDSLEKYGGSVDWSREVTGFENSKDGIQVTFADGSSELCDYLIGADGIHSRVRTTLGVDYRGIDLPESWSIADVDCEDWPYPDCFVACKLEKGRVVVVVPLEAHRYRLVSNTGNALSALPLPFKVTRTHREGTFHISIRQVDRYNIGNVFLAGDAAHCHSPVGGRGMNLGIADAAEFARRLSDGTLEGYSESRHARGQHVIKASEGLRKFVMSDSVFNALLFRTLTAAVDRLPFLQRGLRDALLHD